MKQKKLAISVIIITNRLDQRFINSLQSAQFAKEIIVVDNQTKKDWSKLNNNFDFKLLKYNQKIIDFSQIKNWVAKKAKFKWLFFLDSDEIISPNSIKFIKQIITENQRPLIKVKRIDYFFNKQLRFGETANKYFTRIGKKNAFKWHRAVHEICLNKNLAKKSRVVIQHFPHLSIKTFIEKINHYAYLEAKYRLNKNKDLNLIKVYLQMIFFPIGKFIYTYFLKLGFLDGFAGFIYSFMMSLHSLLVRIYLYEKKL